MAPQPIAWANVAGILPQQKHRISKDSGNCGYSYFYMNVFDIFKAG
jgi:hypothetical protein